MSTYLFRVINQFNIADDLVFNNTKTSTVVYGSIRQTGEYINIGNQNWSIFEATQKKVHNDQIFIDDTPYDSYESRNIFNIYINPDRTLLIAVGSTKIVNSFLKKLNSVCDTVEINNPNFDFDLIATRLANVYAVWMNTENNPQVNTEALMGPRVLNDTRAHDAINTNRATYLVTRIDIDGRERSIGFSKKGSIILINPFQPMSENERINLIYTTFKYVTRIH
ncbi:MAG: hypothetical protein LKJ22_00840 [Liquorilactobacillus nagelii]|uniref:hypothetical protein n=1 Tax=Liquorilactobacillus nagelii TaxID=82688 RepID=UPI00243212EC|nr:hypothetical protein [Liquorilactobacillus nagelii]MCI1920449.1 hypothetical protein [Liquorilactobacillus nagelii]MCI1976093.1 hypothetical protein [Liquorilactobacillus nagelii]